MAKAASKTKTAPAKSRTSAASTARGAKPKAAKPQSRPAAKPAGKAAAKSAVAKSVARPAAKSTAKTVAKPVAKATKSKVVKPVASKPAAAKPIAVKAGKWVYTFGNGKAEGQAGLKELLGGKGANLAEMANLGLPVPPGFTIPTSVCTYFYANDKTYPRELKAQVEAALAHISKITGKGFGDIRNPLLVSVRSGARASMPGMMDTVLNLGLNDDTVEALAEKSGDRRFAYDSYRRFITMYSDVVLGF